MYYHPPPPAQALLPTPGASGASRRPRSHTKRRAHLHAAIVKETLLDAVDCARNPQYGTRPAVPGFYLDALDGPLALPRPLLGQDAPPDGHAVRPPVLREGNVLELHGPPACGKSSLVYHMLLTRVVPTAAVFVAPVGGVGVSVPLYGLGARVAFVDCDGRFDVRRVRDLIATHVGRSLSASLAPYGLATSEYAGGDPATVAAAAEWTAQVAREALARIAVYRVRSYPELCATLALLARSAEDPFGAAAARPTPGPAGAFAVPPTSDGSAPPPRRRRTEVVPGTVFIDSLTALLRPLKMSRNIDLPAAYRKDRGQSFQQASVQLAALVRRLQKRRVTLIVTTAQVFGVPPSAVPWHETGEALVPWWPVTRDASVSGRPYGRTDADAKDAVAAADYLGGALSRVVTARICVQRCAPDAFAGEHVDPTVPIAATIGCLMVAPFRAWPPRPVEVHELGVRDRVSYSQ
ncbi:hypothetical protein H9P43_008933 [Blastocladiella emersonii ATCC 22665]|nr:hypothetical protein H9P43_008933 [Blastocladiella emersonii ATCC 22665]